VPASPSTIALTLKHYIDDLAATAKLLEGERHLPKPRGKRKRDA
jgi:F420-0:gamma-glutamyl ligase